MINFTKIYYYIEFQLILLTSQLKLDPVVVEFDRHLAVLCHNNGLDELLDPVVEVHRSTENILPNEFKLGPVLLLSQEFIKAPLTHSLPHKLVYDLYERP